MIVLRNVLTLQTQIGSLPDEANEIVGYGVMVTLQILVLSFLVRVRVSQRFEAKQHMGCLAFFVC